MSGNRWDAMHIREYTTASGEVKTSWTKIGAGFTNQNGSINVLLDCLPMDGKIQLQVPLSQEEKDALFQKKHQGGGQRQEYSQNQRAQPPPGQGYNPRNAGQQQRAGAAQRYGQRGPSNPQAMAPAAPYVPPQDQGEEGWEVDGVWITDARNLPKDHPDHAPF